MAKRTRWIVAVGILAAALVGRSTAEYVRLSLQEKHLNRQLDQIQSQHDDLIKRRKRFQNDPAYVEGLIRTTFKQARKDEYVIPLSSLEERGAGKAAAAR